MVEAKYHHHNSSWSFFLHLRKRKETEYKKAWTNDIFSSIVRFFIIRATSKTSAAEMTKEAEKNNLLGAFSIFAIAKMESSGYSGSQLTRSQGTVAFKGMSVVMSREDSSITFPLSGKNWGYERWRSFSFSLRFINQRNREGTSEKRRNLSAIIFYPLSFGYLRHKKETKSIGLWRLFPF